MSQLLQPSLPLVHLPVPNIIEDTVRGSDIKITNALAPLARDANARYLYTALLLIANQTSGAISISGGPFRYVNVGYGDIIKFIAGHRRVRIHKKSIQRAIKLLKHLRYIERTQDPQMDHIPSGYAVLTCPSVMEMLRQAGVTHVRYVGKKEVQFLRPLPGPESR